MKTWIVFACLLYACVAYPADTEPTNVNLCEMDIKPGVFENKLVPGGQYLHDTTIYQTAEDCMRSCCDQALAAAVSNQIPCNMAYYYQEPDPYNPVTLRNVCVWWNCKPGECQPNWNVAPDSTARVGFLLPLEQQQPQQQQVQQQQQLLQQQPLQGQQQQLYPEQNANIPEISQYGAVQPNYQHPADSSQGQQVVQQYQPGYGQYVTQEAVPTNQHHQPIPTSQYQNQDLPQLNGMPSEQTGTIPAQDTSSQGRWIYDPNTGQYVFTNPIQAAGQPAPVPTGSDLIQENVTSLNESGLGLEANKTNLDNTTDSGVTPTTTEVYTTTEDQGWFWGKWWNTDDDDDDDDDDDFEDFEDDDEDKVGEPYTKEGRNNTGYWEEEAEWEKEEEEEEEEEWEKELEEWEKEEEEEEEEDKGMNMMTKSTYVTTTLSADKIVEIEKQEEEELEEWLKNYEDVDDGTYGEDKDEDEFDDDDDAGVEPKQPSIITEGIYRPDTYSQNLQSDWSVNTPVIVVGSCAAVVLIALVFILVGKKIVGKTDRAQYKPLKESFSGSATYHEDI